MTVQEMHEQFKIGLDKVDSLSVPNFLPEEVDIFLNNAQEQFIEQRAYGGNPKRQGLEETQKRLDDLKNITKNFDSATFIQNSNNKPNGSFVNLPTDYRHAMEEEVEVSYVDCNNSTVITRPEVDPTTHDRYNRIIKDPFNKPDRTVVYRLGYERVNNVEAFELVPSANETLIRYYLRYTREPIRIQQGSIYQTPLADQDCELSNHTHREIVAIAVKNALEGIESPRYPTNKNELNEIE